MIKHINSLRRFDFTDDCKTCRYCKKLDELEYCCSFVYDYFHEQRLLELKKHMLDYVLNDDELEKVEASNVFFSDTDKWCVSLSFKTNLRRERQLIAYEIRKALNKSPFFRDVQVNSINSSKDEDKENLLLETFVEEYLNSNGGGLV